MFTVRHFCLLVSAFVVLLSCGEPPTSPAATWVEVGRAQELRLEPRPDAASPTAAVARLRAAPGEESQLALARAYFPELLTGTPTANLSAVRPETLLHVRMPSTQGGELVLTTRGLTFTVRQTGSGDAALRSSQGAAFYGEGHFWMAPGGSGDEAGVWRTPRVEELFVLPEGGGVHRARYELTLPPEVTHARDVGDYLELVDAHEVPVLRLHYTVARDAAGLSRQGRVRLLSAVAEASPVGAPVRYAVGRTLSVEMRVDLEGLSGPVVVDPGFSSTGSPSIHRYRAAVSLLPSGKVLAAGGGPDPSATCEVYDPVSGTWSGTGSMAGIRESAATLMLPNGKVLVAGSETSNSAATAELYNPETGTWSTTGALPGPRRLHSLTLLRNGKVLLAGGNDTPSGAPLSSAALYDPATGRWSATGAMPQGQSGHSATLLPSGEVLVTGGYKNTAAGSPAMIYNPDTGTWRQPGMLPFHTTLTATLLASGKVLLVGGSTSTLYDPATGAVTTVPLTEWRTASSATLLPSGRVLVAGSATGGKADETSEIYDPDTHTWTRASALPLSFAGHVAVMLSTGKVLLTANGTTLSVLYETGEFTWGDAPSPASQRVQAAAALLPTGKVLVTGGSGSDGPSGHRRAV